jgi:hypothetical protein
MSTVEERGGKNDTSNKRRPEREIVRSEVFREWHAKMEEGRPKAYNRIRQ